MSNETAGARANLATATREMIGGDHRSGGTWVEMPEDFDLEAAYRAIHGLTVTVSWLLSAIENLEAAHERVDTARANHRRPAL